MAKTRKSSSGDSGATHPYLIPRCYMAIAWERLSRDRGLLAPSYRELLERQIRDCQKVIAKQNRSSFHFPKSQE